MAYRHCFICKVCQKHVYAITEYDMAGAPGRTHGEALENGAMPTTSNDPTGAGCMGEIIFCAGFNLKTNKNCHPAHKGTESFLPAPTMVNSPEWNDFVARVSGAWGNFAASNYNVAQRGANNHREYRVPTAVQQRLQASGGVVNINGATYTVSNSLTAGVSLHRAIPPAHQTATVRSFIFHM